MVTYNSDRCVQCTLVGDAAVGKTSLALTYTTQVTDTPHPHTVFDNYAGTTKTASNQDCTVSVFDCSSQPDHDNIRVFAYKDSEAFVLCYSVMDRDSFENIKSKWLPEIVHFMGKRVPVVLVATQTDRRESIDLDQDIPVSKSEGVELAEEIGADSFVECSQCNKDSIQSVFRDVVQCCIKHKKKKHSIVKRIFGTK